MTALSIALSSPPSRSCSPRSRASDRGAAGALGHGGDEEGKGALTKLIDRGKAFAEINDTTRAEQYFAAAIAAGADERQVIPLLLTVCAQDGRYRVAIQYAEAYLKGHPKDLRVRFVRRLGRSTRR